MCHAIFKHAFLIDNFRVQQSVFSAREACSMGQPTEANQRVEELQRTVQAVASPSKVRPLCVALGGV